jgi:acyl-CoA synthetase (AMP-forming)/AMP-acid ligase II
VVVRSAVDPGELLARAKEHLSAYKVPRHLAVFTDDDQLPWLDSGKVDRRGVADLLARRAGRSEV